MLADIQIDVEALRRLAEARAQAALNWLVGTGKVAAARVFLVAPKLDAKGITDKGKTTRVDFSLK